jgi:Rnl2 family RNA ligase
MAEFQGYGKMGLGAPKAQGGDVAKSASWCVLEKVHGANFSVHVNRSGQMRCAKRTGFLEEHEDFFGHFSMLVRRRLQLTSLAQELLEQDPAARSVVLYGELFGGRYLHPAVDADSMARRPVQTGVWYCPHILFDAAKLSEGGGSFETYSNVVELALKHGLLCAKPLHVGTRGECANYNPKFSSTIPALLELPPIEGNMAEGIVVKPWNVQTPLNDRPIFKVKTKEFSEGEGSMPPPGDPSMRDYLLSLVNSNRVSAAASKVGSPTDKNNWVAIVDLVIADIIEDVGDEDQEFQRLENQLRCEAFDIIAGSCDDF